VKTQRPQGGGAPPPQPSSKEHKSQIRQWQLDEERRPRKRQMGLKTFSFPSGLANRMAKKSDEDERMGSAGYGLYGP